MNLKGFHRNLRLLRKQTGFTQEKMAEELSTSYSHYSKLETGNKQPSLEMIFNICQYFDIPLDYLFKDEGYQIFSDHVNAEIIREMQELPEDEYKLLSNVLEFIYLKIGKRKALHTTDDIQ